MQWWKTATRAIDTTAWHDMASHHIAHIACMGIRLLVLVLVLVLVHGERIRSMQNTFVCFVYGPMSDGSDDRALRRIRMVYINIAELKIL